MIIQVPDTVLASNTQKQLTDESNWFHLFTDVNSRHYIRSLSCCRSDFIRFPGSPAGLGLQSRSERAHGGWCTGHDSHLFFTGHSSVMRSVRISQAMMHWFHALVQRSTKGRRKTCHTGNSNKTQTSCASTHDRDCIHGSKPCHNMSHIKNDWLSYPAR